MIDWRDHASSTEERHLEDSRNHGDAVFRKYAASVLDAIVMNRSKRYMSEENHIKFKYAWNRDPTHSLVKPIKNKVSEILGELDYASGGYGHQGAEWMDNKAKDIAATIHRILD